MKRIIIVLSILVIILSSCTTESEKNENSETLVKKAKIEFDKYSHNFGDIVKDEIVAHNFTFKNTGESNLLITKTKTSCGCTVPKYSDKPIPPGGTGSIEVQFNSRGKRGYNHKTITVFTNGEPEKVMLEIEVKVNQNQK